MAIEPNLNQSMRLRRESEERSETSVFGTLALLGAGLLLTGCKTGARN